MLTNNWINRTTRSIIKHKDFESSQFEYHCQFFLEVQRNDEVDVNRQSSINLKRIRNINILNNGEIVCFDVRVEGKVSKYR